MVHNFQEGGYGFRLRHKGIHSFQLALWYPVIGGQKHERDIWFTSLHVRRSNITVHLRHVIVEKHQIHWMRDKRLQSFPSICSGQNLKPVLFRAVPKWRVCFEETPGFCRPWRGISRG